MARHYPRGVCAVTLTRDGESFAVLAETFVAISEEPPRVVMLFSDRRAAAVLSEPGQGFGINILSAEHEQLCRALASDRLVPLDEASRRQGPGGVPVLTRAVAWIDCTVEKTAEIEDLKMVFARVHSQGESSLAPLIGFQGGYGELTTSSLTAHGEDLHEQLALVDLVRDEMEAVADEMGCRVVAQTLVGDQLIFLASAGHLSRYISPVVTVGDRAAAVPPLGALFKAWAGAQEVEHWLSALDGEAARDRARRQLEDIRNRGYTVYLRSDDDELWRQAAQGLLPARREDLTPEQVKMINALRQDPPDFAADDAQEVEWLAVPVFAPDSSVALVLGIEGLDYPRDWNEFESRLARLEQAASSATRAIGGRVPLPGLRVGPGEK